MVASPVTPFSGLYDSYNARASGQDSGLAWTSESESESVTSVTNDSISSGYDMTDVSDSETARSTNATTEVNQVNQISNNTMVNLFSQTPANNLSDGLPKSIVDALNRLGKQMKQEIENENKRVAEANKKELYAKSRALNDENETLKKKRKGKSRAGEKSGCITNRSSGPLSKLKSSIAMSV